MFTLDPRLARDTLPVGDLPLSRVLLMNDATWPWVILVPRRAEIREIYQLDEADRAQLLRESCQVAELLAELFAADKLNVAALGNVVPQLHLHHVVRHRSDPAWPAPVWGRGPALPYPPDLAAELCERLRARLDGLLPLP